MTKLIQALLLGIVGLVVLAAASPALTKLVHSAIPLLAVAGIVGSLVRIVWFYTR
jgi:hypothetical protein